MIEHWSKIKESGATTGMKFMFFVYRTCGRRVFTLLLYPIIAYYFLTNQQARYASIDYISRVQSYTNNALSKKQLHILSFKHFLQFGNSLIDKLAVWSGAINEENVHFHNIDELKKLREKNVGAIIIMSHLGNQEISRALATKDRSVKLNILVHTKHAQKFNQLLNETNTDSHLNLIQVTEVTPATAITLKTKIDRGEMVVIAGDRTPVNGGHQIPASFLGSPAAFPQGPYILASILECPVLLMFNVKNSLHYDIYFERFSDKISLNRKTRKSDSIFWAQKFADRLAEHTLRHPLQWNNFYSFWSRNDEV